MKAYLYLQGCRCPKCSHRSYKYTTEEWVSLVQQIYGDDYDYSQTVYINNHTKVCVICNKCGKEFWIRPNNHLSQKQGCPNCNHRSYAYTTEEWINLAKEVHKNDDYDYSKVVYINNHTPVCIICKEHGEFWQTPSAHLQGHGCSICAIEKKY